MSKKNIVNIQGIKITTDLDNLEELLDEYGIDNEIENDEYMLYTPPDIWGMAVFLRTIDPSNNYIVASVFDNGVYEVAFSLNKCPEHLKEYYKDGYFVGTSDPSGMTRLEKNNSDIFKNRIEYWGDETSLEYELTFRADDWNPRKTQEENIYNDNGINQEYMTDSMYVKYNKTNGIINGVKETFFNDILIKSEEYKNGSINGIVKTFNKQNGAIKSKTINLDEKTIDIKYEYWDNSQDSTKWIPNGTVRNLNYIKNNIGINLRFGINGGVGGGDFHSYHLGTVMNMETRENGYVQDVFSFGDSPIGIWYSFKNNGNILHLTKFKAGKRMDLSESDEKKLIDSVNIFECHYPNGNILESREMKGGKVHGTWKRFYSNGILRYITNHKNGDMDGEAKGWDENGYLVFEEKWENGNQIG